MPFKVGDEVFAMGRVTESGKIVLADSLDHLTQEQYTLRIPVVIFLPNGEGEWLIHIVDPTKISAWVATEWHVKYHPGIVLGNYYWWVSAAVLLPRITAPVVCKICNTTNEYAVPNQQDGTYICYEHPRQ